MRGCEVLRGGVGGGGGLLAGGWDAGMVACEVGGRGAGARWMDGWMDGGRASLVGFISRSRSIFRVQM
jgi:hypothetical protein